MSLKKTILSTLAIATISSSTQAGASNFKSCDEAIAYFKDDWKYYKKTQPSQAEVDANVAERRELAPLFRPIFEKETEEMNAFLKGLDRSDLARMRNATSEKQKQKIFDEIRNKYNPAKFNGGAYPIRDGVWGAVMSPNFLFTNYPFIHVCTQVFPVNAPVTEPKVVGAHRIKLPKLGYFSPGICVSPDKLNAWIENGGQPPQVTVNDYVDEFLDDYSRHFESVDPFIAWSLNREKMDCPGYDSQILPFLKSGLLVPVSHEPVANQTFDRAQKPATPDHAAGTEKQESTAHPAH
jgi:hypothetical protein